MMQDHIVDGLKLRSNVRVRVICRSGNRLKGSAMNEPLPNVDPARTILLVMDYQSAIIRSIPDSGALLDRVATLVAATRSSWIAVGYGRVALVDADYAAVPAPNKSFAALARRRLMADGTPDTAIYPTLSPRSGDIVVRKTRVGAFSTTDLDSQLHDRAPSTWCSRDSIRACRPFDRTRRRRSRLSDSRCG